MGICDCEWLVLYKTGTIVFGAISLGTLVGILWRMWRNLNNRE